MADLPDEPEWADGIYLLEKTDPASGGSEIDPNTKQGILNLPHLQLANRTKWLRKRFEETTVEEELLVEVGSGGDFGTITDALKELSRSRQIYTGDGFTAEIRMKSGMALEEQIFVAGLDLSWIKITSEDAEVPIVRSALSTVLDTNLGGGNIFPVFGAKLGGFLPLIDVLFEMDSSGSASGREFIACINSGQAAMIPGAGCKNVGARALREQKLRHRRHGRRLSRCWRRYGRGSARQQDLVFR